MSLVFFIILCACKGISGTSMQPVELHVMHGCLFWQDLETKLFLPNLPVFVAEGVVLLLKAKFILLVNLIEIRQVVN